MENLTIRSATPGDATQIQRIYAPYVRDTAITFEYAIPSVEEMEERIRKTLQEYPYLVAEWDGRIVGYAYASIFHGREAYKHTVETSIYLDMDYRGKGIGVALYEALEEILLKQNVYVMYACITNSEDETDLHVTDKSVRFHEHLGYKQIGKHTNSGYKFDAWYSIVWMEKEIAPRPAHPDPFIPLAELRK